MNKGGGYTVHIASRRTRSKYAAAQIAGQKFIIFSEFVLMPKTFARLRRKYITINVLNQLHVDNPYIRFPIGK